jgi:hypothetical protein
MQICAIMNLLLSIVQSETIRKSIEKKMDHVSDDRIPTVDYRSIVVLL